jgi:hypothetical protein
VRYAWPAYSFTISLPDLLKHTPPTKRQTGYIWTFAAEDLATKGQNVCWTWKICGIASPLFASFSHQGTVARGPVAGVSAGRNNRRIHRAVLRLSSKDQPQHHHRLAAAQAHFHTAGAPPRRNSRAPQATLSSYDVAAAAGLYVNADSRSTRRAQTWHLRRYDASSRRRACPMRVSVRR